MAIAVFGALVADPIRFVVGMQTSLLIATALLAVAVLGAARIRPTPTVIINLDPNQGRC